MAYQANIPLAADRISKSQADINGNFTALSPFGNGYCDLPQKAPAPTFPGTDQGIYAFLNPTTGVSETYFHKQSVDSPAEVPGTACKMSNTAKNTCVNGWTYLPSGLLVKWGSILATNALIFPVDVGTLSGGPVYTKVFQTYLTPNWGGPVANDASVPFLAAGGTTTAGNFNCFVSNYSATRSRLNYMVIGV